ncbi:MAG: tRNA 2-thiouridine(34) synthase MnmA [Chloroflexi bacterium]|nr:tRNA 2-thiouridine(34) synthase MnmA [Chloroflexota bacterium]
MTKKRVVVAMSGGVDSSVAAALLQDDGYEVIGVTMRLWSLDDAEAPRHHRRCCSVEDTEDARAACDALGVPHYVLNFEREFAGGVVDRFVQEYSLGRTPNPCLACNQHVKFKPLLAHALALDADYLATGHYARVRANGRGFELWKAVDPAKDQSYVLYTLGQAELARTLFPVGEHSKDEIRRIARESGLPNAGKPDSADICFIPSGDYRRFVRERLSPEPGDIVDGAGNRLGRHAGITDYTVGQRRGVPARGGSEPLYVLRLEAATNTVVVGPEEELLAGGLIAEDVSFVCGSPPEGTVEVEAKIRYRSEPAPAVLTVRDGRAEVRFRRPQRAVTPGQAVVFYRGERVLGGGTIVKALRGWKLLTCGHPI